MTGEQFAFFQWATLCAKFDSHSESVARRFIYFYRLNLWSVMNARTIEKIQFHII